MMDGNKKETNVEGSQTPKISRIREYMTAKFPDRTYTDDDDFDNAVLEHLKTSDAKIAGNDAANKTIMEVIAAYPEFAEIIEDVAEGVPVRVAIARQFSPDELTVRDGEEDFDAYRKAAEDRSKRLAEINERIHTREKNIAQSKTDVDAFFNEMQMTDQERTAFVDWVDNEVLANLMDGRVNREILIKLYQGWKFDEAVAEARNAGEVEGRNQQIEQKRAHATKTDGLASGGSGAVTVQPQKPSSDFIDEVLTRKSRRKF